MEYVIQEVYILLFKFRSGTHGLNEELGRHRGREGKTECSLCGDECENVSNVLWECSAHTVYVKKNTTLIKICVPLFDKKRVALLWFASEFVRGAYCGTFANAPHFHGESVAMHALQDDALSGIASKCGAHRGISVRRANQCRGDTFVAFFFTYMLVVLELVL